MEKSYNCCEFLTPFFPVRVFSQQSLYSITFIKMNKARKSCDCPGLCYSNIAIELGCAFLYVDEPYGPLKILDVAVNLAL